MSTSQPTSANSFNRPVPLWVQGVITGGALATWFMTAGLFVLLSIRPGDGSFNFLKVPAIVAAAIAAGAVLFAYLPEQGATNRPVDLVEAEGDTLVTDGQYVPLALVWSATDEPAQAVSHR